MKTSITRVEREIFVENDRGEMALAGFVAIQLSDDGTWIAEVDETISVLGKNADEWLVNYTEIKVKDSSQEALL